MTQRLGWLGPVIVIVGAIVAGFGAWFMITSRPTAGPIIDRLAIDDQHALIVRSEDGGPRSFVELHEGDRVLWQALVPRYAGRPGVPGIAWSPVAVSVRVIRNGFAEIFALSMHDSSKLGGMRLAPDHGAVTVDAPGPVTLTDHERSYEVVSGPGWHQLTAIDLRTGKALWSHDLGPDAVKDGGVINGRVWIDQGKGPIWFVGLSGESPRADST